jgi:thioredoxin-like negative regulator of GroEL
LLGVSYDLMESNDGAKSKRRIERVFKKAAVGEFTTVLYDGDDFDGINASLGLSGGIPQTVAIDANGKIVDRQRGMASEDRFEQMMRKALGK